MKLFCGHKEDNSNLFHTAIQSFDALISQADSLEEKCRICDFCIKIIASEMAVSRFYYLIYLGDHKNTNRVSVIPFIKPQGKEKITIGSKIVVSAPWSYRKLGRAILDTEQHGLAADYRTSYGSYYEELNLVIIRTRFHHAATASIRGKGTCTVERYRLKDYFDTLNTNGVTWFYGTEEESVRDYRLAVLYQIAKQKHQYKNASSN